ncbi:pyridoxal phosphate-dependent aminotransferase [Mogibacterium timidum]|jgi:hypothetical protein|nr:histidinol-phosphate transaminase [Mogibacterium timidum]
MKVRGALMSIDKTRIRDELIPEIRSYADNTPVADEHTLDCSLGINPYGFPDVVIDIVRNFDVNRLYQYPHSDEAQEAVVNYWQDYAFIEPENVVMTDGSVTALNLLVNVFAKPGAEAVMFMPTFTDMVEYSRIMGMKVHGVVTSAENNFKEDVNRLVGTINDNTSFVYIDNPNNPTGQFLSNAELERIISKCEEMKVYAIIDEAYADFIPREESAVMLGPKYSHMISVRTFSKGFGLAGARAGYIITNKELVKYIKKVSNPYMMNEMSRAITAAILNYDVQPVEHGTDFSIIKGALRDACGSKIIMAETDDRVPICLLRHVDDDIDLQRMLMNENVLTCSGSEFEPLGRNCVRLRVPTLKDAGKLIKAIRNVVSA